MRRVSSLSELHTSLGIVWGLIGGENYQLHEYAGKVDHLFDRWKGEMTEASKLTGVNASWLTSMKTNNIIDVLVNKEEAWISQFTG